MRIGLAGVGRIGAFHAETLRSLSDVDELVVSDLDADAARALAERLEVGFAASPARDARRRASTASSSRPPPRATPRCCGSASRPACRPSARSRSPRPSTRRWARQARRPDEHPRARRLPAPLRLRLPAGPAGRRGRRARLRAQHPRARPTTRPRRTPPTSRRAAGSSATARSTTSTSSASSPAARSPRSTRPAPTRAPPSSARPATSTPPPRVLTLDDGTLVSLSATRYNGAGHDVRMEVLGSEGTARRRLRRLARRDLGRARRDLPVRPPALVLHGALPARLPRRADRLRGGRPRGAARRRAPSTTRSRRSASPRRASCPAHEGRVVSLDEIPSL